MKAKSILSFIDKLKKEGKFPVSKFINAHSKKQREFLKCLHHTILFIGAKRSGKTLAGISRVVLTDQTFPQGPRIVLAGANLEKIKSLYWNSLWTVNDFFDLGWEFRAGDNLIQTKKRQIIFRSLRDLPNADKDTGFQVCLALVEEGHTLRNHILNYWVENIIRINFLNVDNACLVLICNPPVYPLPKFKDNYYLNSEVKKFHIVPEDNPSIPKRALKKFMLQEAKSLGFNSVEEAKVKSNSFRRNFLGEWVEDKGRIIIDSNKVQFFKELPKDEMSYSIGVDLGAGKAKDAIIVIGYNKYEKKAWVVEEMEIDTYEEDLEKLATQIKYRYEKYKPHSINIDTGGVGNRIAHTLSYRYGIPCVVPAIKQDKMAHVEELKAEIYRGRLFFKENSLLVKEFPQIIYNEDHSEIDDEAGIHSDLFDACLYGIRAVWNAYPSARPPEPSYKQKRLKEIRERRKKSRSIGY